MTVRHPWIFVTGIGMLLVALSPPIEDAAAELFSIHMIQHLTLMIVVPPLLLVGWPRMVSLPRAFTSPLVVGLLLITAMWAWHLPALYDGAIGNNLLHILEHGSFLITGFLFWGTVMARFRPLDTPSRVGLVFATALASGALGAILAFASTPLYESHRLATATWGLTPLEDQQLAGGIMWVPTGAIYLAVMLVLLLRWFRAMDADAAPSGVGEG